MMQKGGAAAEAQSQDAPSLLKLYHTKLWLQNRLLQSQAAATAVVSRTNNEDDLESVLDRVAKLQKSLQTVATKHTLGELLKQRLQLSTGLSEAVFPVISHDVDATWEPTQQQALQTLVERHGELNTNICKIHQEMTEKKPILIELEKQNLELKLENRELMAQLLERKRVIEKSEGWRQRSAKVQRAEGKLSDMVSQVTLMQNSFQCLIVGSAVDWAVDDRLCELMVSLGKPLNMQLDDLHDSDTRSDVDTSH